MVAVGANDGRAGVIDYVGEVVRSQPVVNRHQDSAELRHCVERLQLAVSIRRDVGHPVALVYTESRKRARPAITALEELLVGQAATILVHRLDLGIEAPGAASKLQRAQGYFHLSSLGPQEFVTREPACRTSGRAAWSRARLVEDAGSLGVPAAAVA